MSARSFQFQRKIQKGISLIEILLVTVIVASAVVGVLVFSKNAKLTAAVSAEQAQVEQTVKTITGLFSTQPNYGALSADYLNSRASGSGLSFSKDTNGEILLSHNLPSRVTARIQPANVQFRPNAAPLVQRPASGNAFAISYSGLETKECLNLVTALSPSSTLTRVQPGTGGAARHVSIRGQQVVDKDQIIQGCTTSRNNPNALVVLYFQGNMSASAPPPVSTVLPTCSPTTENQTIACPTGQQGSITQQRSGACTGAGGSLVWSSWATVENTCVDIPTAPADVVPEDIEEDCVDNQFTRVVACPAGEVGQVTQSRTVNSCSGNTSAWVEVSRSCVSAGAPAATCLPTTEQRVQPCPAGQGGQQIQERSSSCASPTASPTWSSWNTISNNCTASCASTGTCCVPLRETRSVSNQCPAGTYGTSGAEEERFRSCLNATTVGPWTAWTVQSTNATCNACPGATTETERQWLAGSESCPSGQTGSITFEYERSRSRTKSYNCPAGTTTLPAASYSAWTGWNNTGARRNVVNTCKTASQSIRAIGFFGSAGSWWNDALSTTANVYSKGSFVAGPVRNFLGACPSSGYPAASSYNMYDICVVGAWPPSGSASCTVAAGTSFSWSNSDSYNGIVKTCSGTVPSARTVASGATFDVTGSPSTNRGTFMCVNGNVVAWPVWNNCM